MKEMFFYLVVYILMKVKIIYEVTIFVTVCIQYNMCVVREIGVGMEFTCFCLIFCNRYECSYCSSNIYGI